MLVKPYHIPKIISGEKTQTRRIWKRPHAKVGGTYPVQTGFCQPAKTCIGWIRVTRMWTEYGRDMIALDPAHAKAEGGYTPEEYYRVLTEINGDVPPDAIITALEFEFVPNLDWDWTTYPELIGESQVSAQFEKTRLHVGDHVVVAGKPFRVERVAMTTVEYTP